MDGIFYKKWFYVPQQAPEVRQIPLLIVTDAKALESGSSVFMTILPFVCGALAAGLVIFFVGMALRDRRQLREFRERYAARQSARESGSGPPSDEPPPE